MIYTEHYRKLENLYHSHPLNNLYQAQIKISENTAEVKIPVKESLFHAAHAVHGSVYFKALDDAAFFAVNSTIMEVFVLTTTFTTYLTRPVTKGIMRAVGNLVNTTRSQYIAGAILYNEDKEVGRGSGIYVRSRIRLNEKVGYK
ncbi:MAG: PaaI family thioesterase [Candidatus Hodarchaeota archaeon]